MAGAYILAGELRRANGDHTQGFKAYEKRLHAFVDDKQRAAECFAASFAPRTWFGLSVRDLILRGAAFSLPLGKWVVRKMVGDHFELFDYSL